MKKLILGMVLVNLLAACASQEAKDTKASVEDKSPAAIAEKAAEPSVQTAAIQTAPAQQQALEPLKDPANILSRRSVYFDYDSSAVKDEYKSMVEAHAKYIVGRPSAHVTLQGNCDERGSREYNLALGQRRAEAVKKMMTVLGVVDKQIEAVSLGEEKPKAAGNDEASWAQNRRTDIVYQGE